METRRSRERSAIEKGASQNQIPSMSAPAKQAKATAKVPAKQESRQGRPRGGRCVCSFRARSFSTWLISSSHRRRVRAKLEKQKQNQLQQVAKPVVDTAIVREKKALAAPAAKPVDVSAGPSVPGRSILHEVQALFNLGQQQADQKPEPPKAASVASPSAPRETARSVEKLVEQQSPVAAEASAGSAQSPVASASPQQKPSLGQPQQQPLPPGPPPGFALPPPIPCHACRVMVHPHQWQVRIVAVIPSLTSSACRLTCTLRVMPRTLVCC
jgi:hypothetical protein